MKKIVINACFGGFSLSDAAEDLYRAKRGEGKLFRYTDEGDFNDRSYVRATGESFFCHTFTKDLGDTFTKYQDDLYYSSRDIARDDPALVAVVEELGQEASGDCASLSIVEIPDDIKWHISEYDGNEHVAEDHGTWS
jgi:hypothetical protein